MHVCVRFLKDAMWQKAKKTEVTQRQKLQRLKESLQFWHHLDKCKDKVLLQILLRESIITITSYTHHLWTGKENSSFYTYIHLYTSLPDFIHI